MACPFRRVGSNGVTKRALSRRRRLLCVPVVTLTLTIPLNVTLDGTLALYPTPTPNPRPKPDTNSNNPYLRPPVTTSHLSLSLSLSLCLTLTLPSGVRRRARHHIPTSRDRLDRSLWPATGALTLPLTLIRLFRPDAQCYSHLAWILHPKLFLSNCKPHP